MFDDEMTTPVETREEGMEPETETSEDAPEGTGMGDNTDETAA